MKSSLVSRRAAQSSALLSAVLVSLTSIASAQTTTAPAAPAAPVAAPVAATPVAPAKPAAATPAPAAATAPAATPTAEPSSAAAPTVGAVQPGFPEPAAAATAATSPSAELSAGTIAVTTSAPLAVAEQPAADPNAGSVTFKPGKGVDIKSADGNFLLNTRLRLQFLDELRSPAAASKKTRNSIVLRRVRLTFGGNVFSKDIKYKLDLALSTPELGRESVAAVDPNDAKTVAGTTDRDVTTQGPLVDVYVDFTHVRDANLHVGQSKVPFSLERLYSDGDMRTVDRSIVTEEFAFDRDIGFDIRSQDFLGLDMIRYYAGIYSGENRNATLKSVGGGDLGLLYVVRAELFPLGTFDLYEVSDVARSSDAKLAFGVAYAFLQTDATSPGAKQQLGTVLGGPATEAVVDYNTHNFTADATFKLAGFSAMTALNIRKVTTIANAHNGIGWSVQAGYILSEALPLEGAAGFNMIRPLKAATSSIAQLNELTLGLNYYIYGQALKVQGEYAHLWDQKTAGLADNRVRVQLQASL